MPNGAWSKAKSIGAPRSPKRYLPNLWKAFTSPQDYLRQVMNPDEGIELPSQTKALLPEEADPITKFTRFFLDPTYGSEDKEYKPGLAEGLGATLGAAATLPMGSRMLPTRSALLDKLSKSLGKTLPLQEFRSVFGKPGAGVTKAEIGQSGIEAISTPKVTIDDTLLDKIHKSLPEYHYAANPGGTYADYNIGDTYANIYDTAPGWSKKFMDQIYDVNMPEGQQYTRDAYHKLHRLIQDVPDESRVGGHIQRHITGPGEDLGVAHIRGGIGVAGEGNPNEAAKALIVGEIQSDPGAAISTALRNNLKITSEESKEAVQRAKALIDQLGVEGAASHPGLADVFGNEEARNVLTNLIYSIQQGYIPQEAVAGNPYISLLQRLDDAYKGLGQAKKGQVFESIHPGFSYNQYIPLSIATAVDKAMYTPGINQVAFAPAHLAGTASLVPSELITGGTMKPTGDFSLFGPYATGSGVNTRAFYRGNVRDPFPQGTDIGLDPDSQNTIIRALQHEYDKIINRGESVGALDQLESFMKNDFLGRLRGMNQEEIFRELGRYTNDLMLSDITEAVGSGQLNPYIIRPLRAITEQLAAQRLNPEALSPELRGLLPQENLWSEFPSLFSKSQGNEDLGQASKFQWASPFTIASKDPRGKAMMSFYPSQNLMQTSGINPGAVGNWAQDLFKKQLGLDLQPIVPAGFEKEMWLGANIPKDLKKAYRAGQIEWPLFYGTK